VRNGPDEPENLFVALDRNGCPNAEGSNPGCM